MIATVLLVALVGIPYQRDILAIWLLLGLLCFSLTDLRGYARGVILEWLPFVAILIAYDSLRGTAGHLFGVHYLPQLQIDQALFGGTAPPFPAALALARAGRLVRPDPWGVYLTHFFATPLVAAILWKVDRPRFRYFAVARRPCCRSPGSLTYALYPAAPPWMASQAHLMVPITRILPDVWHAPRRSTRPARWSRTATGTPTTSPPCPSLHAAFSLLDRDHPVAAKAHMAPPARGALPAGHGLLARLHRRALRQRHPAGLDLHGRSTVFAVPGVLRRWRLDARPGAGSGIPA